MKYELCKVPNCSGWVTDKGKRYGLCNKHTSELEFFTWALNNIKISDKIDEIRTKSGLIIPK